MIMEGSPKPIRNAVWHQDSPNVIITASHDDNALRLWDVRTLKEVKSVPTQAPTTSLEVQTGGGILTTAEGNAVKFWSLDTMQLVKEFTLSFPTESASLFAQKNCFVAG